jgi:hypothetical protein
MLQIRLTGVNTPETSPGEGRTAALDRLAIGQRLGLDRRRGLRSARNSSLLPGMTSAEKSSFGRHG